MLEIVLRQRGWGGEEGGVPPPPFLPAARWDQASPPCLVHPGIARSTFWGFALGTHQRQGLPVDVVSAAPSKEPGSRSRLSRSVCCISSKHHAGSMTPQHPGPCHQPKGNNKMCTYVQWTITQPVKWIWITSNEVDEPRVCHTEWSKSEREKNKYHLLMHIYGV